MTPDEKDKTASSDPIQDIEDTYVEADGADNVKGGFNPQPDPPREFIPPFMSKPIKPIQNGP